MLIDENFCSSLTQNDLDLIQKVENCFSLLESDFKFQSQFMDDFGYFFKHVFINSKGDKIGVIFVNFSEIKSDLNKELLYWDIMTMTETLGWNLFIINLELPCSSSQIEESLIQLISRL